MQLKRQAICRATLQARRKKTLRASETDEQQETKLETVRVQTTLSRQTLYADLNLGALHYDANYDCSLHPNMVTGKIDTYCVYCNALKFKNETPGMCCASGKVKLLELHSPIEPLTLIETSQSKHLLGKHVQVQFMFPNDIVWCNKYRA